MTTTPPPPLDPSHPIIAFSGAITTRLLPSPHPSRAFAFEVTFLNSHPTLIRLSTQKPPSHFHPYQEEYIEVLEGKLGLEIEGVERVVGRGEGEVVVGVGERHCLYPPPRPREGGEEGDGQGGEDGGEKTVFLLSGEGTKEVYRLDTVFFQNWYGYQDEVVGRGGRVDLVQVLCMFDAGGSYLSPPWWVPFGRTLSRGLGVVVGRWIGALLGYQPYYKKWTGDWELACEKMETSVLQRRFAVREGEGRAKGE